MNIFLALCYLTTGDSLNFKKLWMWPSTPTLGSFCNYWHLNCFQNAILWNRDNLKMKIMNIYPALSLKNFAILKIYKSSFFKICEEFEVKNKFFDTNLNKTISSSINVKFRETLAILYDNLKKRPSENQMYSKIIKYQNILMLFSHVLTD